MGKSVKQSAASLQWRDLMQDTYATPEIRLIRGSGLEVIDSKGKKYLDLLGGIATNLLGHAHPEVSSAIAKQARKLSHVSNFYSHDSGLELADKLKEMTGEASARIFFCNSGAEANEAALKLSRLTGRKRVIAAKGAFHGRTMGALSLTGQLAKRAPFKPLLRGVSHIPYGDIAALRKVNRRTAMLILEPIMGEAGVIVPPSGYLRAARAACDEAGALLVLDCVQTGMGRTGQWFGYEEEGIVPDAITIAKGLGGGLPLGAMIAIGKAAELFKPGSHGTTFGGNPIACAAANVVIEEINRRNHLKSNAAKGALLINLLSRVSLVKEVRGRGLLVGIELKGDFAKEITARLAAAGFLVNAASDSVLRLAPAYLITEREIKSFVRKFAEICEDYDG